MGRRTFLAAVGTGLAGCTASPAPAPEVHLPVRKQPGVVTPALSTTELMAFDVTVRGRAGLTEVLRALSSPVADAVVTIAVGASLFDGRFGLERPRRLTPMPSFRSDVLDPAWCHGDLLVQVSADSREPVDAALARQIPGLTPRWRMPGFHPDGTRNLFGFREGAGNPDASDAKLMDEHVWVQPGDDEPAWCVGGTYQVVRLIRLAMPSWDAEPLEVQERVFGRTKDTGAPLGQASEHDRPDFASDPGGRRIALNAHIRRANPRTPESEAHKILRRGHSYRLSESDAGQIFVCYQRDVELGFATIQRRLAGEALEKYLLPFGGGYFFVLPGTDDGHVSLG
ncbi:Dyp-type peroxidase [Lentzea nigeriaca]|uniref:Dyp-type peroxidase n=1 Tax=Lentzea nigeriaca TaxID=1128665 RepID=UPI0027DD56D7|nr:Dyp-type peroxidase [Lentzea nigeriaca]MBM7861005.1 deferrochelatase/peroxidase EfeB [Lentzea nigeriaca]